MFLSILLDDIDPIKRFVIKKKDPPINTIIITVNIKAITNFFIFQYPVGLLKIYWKILL